MDWQKLAAQALAGNRRALKTMSAYRKAHKVRAEIAKLLDRDPRRAIEHVNVKLDTASRGEEERANFLAVFSE